jgi:hypothetical protein
MRWARVVLLPPQKLSAAAGMLSWPATWSFRIIDRDTHPLAPTPRGRDFLREARQILRIAHDAEPIRHDPQ